MSDLFFIHTVTVFHLVDDEAIKKVYDLVYFRHNKKANVIDKGIERASSGTLIIPTTEEVAISVRDIVIEGNIADEYNYRNLVRKYHVFKVLSVDDNRKGNLQHYKIGVTD